MTYAHANAEPDPGSFSPDPGKRRAASCGNEPTALANIYREDTNIALWQRDLCDDLKASVETILTSRPGIEVARRVTPQTTESCINEALRITEESDFSRDVAEVVDMFCCLFGLDHAGLRLTALTRAMCPRFHVDKVPCRLVTTYQGPATQWLPHECVDRSRLGAGSNGQSDSASGLYMSSSDIQQLSIGDVGLLKGELWEGNDGAGLVHRSPEVPTAERRLLLTLDIIT